MTHLRSIPRQSHLLNLSSRALSTMSTTKLHGRAFYESIGSPKYVVAPMVDQSEFAWRLLTRSFLPPDLRRSILTYSPMLHAKLFTESIKYRGEHFKPLKAPYELPFPADPAHQKASLESNEPFLDGHPEIDRPLFVQFCANEPEILLDAAKVVAPYCDAVDLNLGCPQGIAKRGGYGAFLQEDWPRIYDLINTLHKNLDIPVTAKMRILETKEKTLEYAKMILSAGASILTVHGRQREQKGHNTGLADWTVIRYLRDNLPAETVMFANGNILQHGDLQKCLDATGVDAIMSAEGNLYDPTIFAPPPANPEEHTRIYWQGRDGKGGYRMDHVLREYLDIIWRHVLCTEPPKRAPLWIPSDPPVVEDEPEVEEDGPPPTKKQKRDNAKSQGKKERIHDVNLTAMQAHMFNMLRAMVGKHTHVRDALAQCRVGEMESFEKVLKLVETATRHGMQDYERDPAAFEDAEPAEDEVEDAESSAAAIRRCKRPFFVCQPHIRPSVKEAIAKGSLKLSKKETKKLQEEEKAAQLAKESGIEPGVERVEASNDTQDPQKQKIDIPREGLVCG